MGIGGFTRFAAATGGYKACLVSIGRIARCGGYPVLTASVVALAGWVAMRGMDGGDRLG